MKYDLVCFDLDGTLIDSFPFIIGSYKKAVIDKYGKITESDQDIIAQIGRPIKFFYSAYPEEDREELQNRFAKDNDKTQTEKGVPFFNGIKEMLLDLKKIAKIGIVTSKRREPLLKWIERECLENLFDVVIAKDDTQTHKPNAEPLLLAIKITNTLPQKTLYVGDAIFDMLCAKNAKVDNCLVGWSLSLNCIIKECKPIYIANSADDILKIAKGDA